MKHLFAMLAGCFMLLTNGHAATVVEHIEGGPGYNITHVREFDSYNTPGDGMGNNPESFLRASIDGTPTTGNSLVDPTKVIEKYGQFSWGTNPEPFVFSFDCETMQLTLQIGEGSGQMTLSVPVREGCFFNGIAVSLFINRGFSPEGSIKMDITNFNGQDFNVHLAASYPAVPGEDQATGFWWNSNTIESFRMEGTVTMENGESWFSSFSMGPVMVTLVTPEPTAVVLLGGGILVLGLQRPRRKTDTL